MENVQGDEGEGRGGLLKEVSVPPVNWMDKRLRFLNYSRSKREARGE